MRWYHFNVDGVRSEQSFSTLASAKWAHGVIFRKDGFGLWTDDRGNYLLKLSEDARELYE